MKSGEAGELRSSDVLVSGLRSRPPRALIVSRARDGEQKSNGPFLVSSSLSLKRTWGGVPPPPPPPPTTRFN